MSRSMVARDANGERGVDWGMGFHKYSCRGRHRLVLDRADATRCRLENRCNCDHLFQQPRWKQEWPGSLNGYYHNQPNQLNQASRPSLSLLSKRPIPSLHLVSCHISSCARPVRSLSSSMSFLLAPCLLCSANFASFLDDPVTSTHGDTGSELGHW